MSLEMLSLSDDAETKAEEATGIDVYVDEVHGKDITGTTGTKDDPFRSLLAAYIRFPPGTNRLTPKLYSRFYLQDSAEWKEISKSALKKTASRCAEHVKKVSREAEGESQRQARVAEAKKFALAYDDNLPTPVRIRMSAREHVDVKYGTEDTTGTRVKVLGRVETIRTSKTRTFVYLTDTHATLLCIFAGSVNTVAPILFQKQMAIEVYGEMKQVPQDNHAPDDRELHVDYYRIIGEAPGGPEAFTNVVPPDTDQSQLTSVRHLLLRRPKESMIMKMRACALGAFRQWYKEHDMREHTAPSFVQTQAEGGSSLFAVPYYGQKAYLTQTSQLYLETQLPVIGDCYAIQSSFRAENSQTRRHLAEYTHVEGELDFITFEDLLQHIEDLLCGVIDKLLADPESAAYIKALNPTFKSPARPFLRMRYSEAIQWLDDHGVMTDEGTAHQLGNDITEAAERSMTDTIGVPILLTHFPVSIKAFYMKKDAVVPDVTESVDCLVPGVGEIVGSGMRMDNLEELLHVMRANKWDLESYGFYSDQRKYGSSPHGGYGLGLERFLAWVLNLHTVRECVPYPRYPGKCAP